MCIQTSTLNGCPVQLYKEYLSHRPEAHDQKGNDAFYLACIPNPRGPVWYKNSRLGIHSIQQATRSLFLGSSLSDKFITNTSLRRTVKNRLVSAGIPNEIAKKKTGRISESADSAYIDGKLYEKEMSNAIYSNHETTHHREVNLQCKNDTRFCFQNCTVNITINECKHPDESE